MARGRMLNNKISASRQMNECLPDDTCRLLATWMIAHLDMNGVFYGEPVLVKSYVFPRKAELDIDHVELYLQTMADVGLIEFFHTDDGERWIHWPEFARNQPGLRPDRESTFFPSPPNNDGVPQDSCRSLDGITPARILQDSSTIPGKEKLSEVKIEVKGSEEGADAPPPKPTRKRRAPAKAKEPPPPAIGAYRSATNLYPEKSLWPGIVKVVGEKPEDLERFKRVCTSWVAMGWNKKNVKGMLQHFTENKIPGDDGPAKGGKRGTDSDIVDIQGYRPIGATPEEFYGTGAK